MNELQDNLTQMQRELHGLDRRVQRVEGEVGFGAASTIVALTATGTAEIYNDILTTNGNFTLNIPSGSSIPGKEYFIKNIGTGTVTVMPAGTTTIDGLGSVTLKRQWDGMTLKSLGGNWVKGGDNVFTSISILESGGTPNKQTTLQGGDQSADIVYVLPTALPPASAYALVSSDAGVLSWSATTTAIAHNLLSATHSDTLVGAVVDGDTIIGNGTPNWSRLAITVPAASVRNVLGVDNGELRPSWKIALDATVPTAITPDDAAAAGTSLVFSHRDHTHGITTVTPSTQAMGDSAAEGTAVTFVRGDHKHAMPSFGTPSIVMGTAAAIGAATTPIRSDATIVAFDNTVPTSIAPDDTAATGSQAYAARRDHVHGITAATASTQAIGDSATEGTVTSFTRSDHKHAMPTYATPALTLGTANAVGAGTSLIRQDATIALFDNTVPTSVTPDDVAATGSQAYAARRDHTHGITTVTPSTQAIGDAAAEGTATTFVRGDHKHAMPAFGTPTIALGTAAMIGAAATLVRSDSTIVAFDATVPGTIAESASAAAGTATVSARRDHVHGAPATWAATAHNVLSATHGDSTAAACVRGDIITGQAISPLWKRLAKGVAGAIVTASADDVLWTTATYPATTTINQILYSSAANTVAGLATGNSGVLVTGATGIPSIATDIPTAVTIGSAYIYRAAGTNVAVADGGTNLDSGTSGGILGYTATGVLASSVLLTASALVLGGGAGATPTPLGSLGTTTTLLHGNAAGAPSWAAVGYADIAAMTSAQLAGIISDETGSGALMFATSPTITTSLIMADGATIGQAAGPLVAFDDTNSYLEIMGCNVGIGATVPNAGMLQVGITAGTAVATYPANLFLNEFNVDGPNAAGGLELATHIGATTEGYGGKLYSNNSGAYIGLATRYGALTWTERMVIREQTGFVGIATTAPDKALEVNSATGACLRLTYNDANGSATYYTDFAVSSAGNLTVTPSGTLLNFPSTASLRQTSYASQTTGWQITGAGSADFRYLYTDELHARAFIADMEQALAGGQIICKSVTKVASDFTLPAAGASDSLVVEELAGFTGHVFVDADLIRLRQTTRAADTSLTIADGWGTVVYASRDGTANPPTQTYIFTRSAAPNAGTGSGTVLANTLALDYGTAANSYGYHEISAVDGAYGVNAPYAQTVTWATHPAVQANRTVRTRIGNLKGITNALEYGLYAGNVLDGGTLATTNRYIRLSDTTFSLNNLDLSIYNGGAKVIAMDYATPYFSIGNPAPTAYGTGTGIWMGLDTVYKFRVGDPAANRVTWDGSVLTIVGTVTATLGYIGGWVIGTTSLTDAAGVVGMSSAVTAGDDIRFWAGHATPASAPFRVTEAGVLTATSGTIAAWTLAATRISSTNVFIDQAGQYISMGATPPTAYGNNVGIWMGVATSGKLSLYADANNYFQYNGAVVTWKGANTALDASGNLTASSATLSGSITATSGTIGGFTVTANELYAGTGATRVEMQAAGGFWAGATAIGDAPFSVTNAGVLKAISGTVGNWTLSATTLQNAGATAILRAAGNLAFGATPPTASNAGTGIFLDSTGLYGLLVDVQQTVVSATTGAITAGAGAVTLDANGINIEVQTGYLTTNSLDFMRGVNRYARLYDVYNDVGAATNALYLWVDGLAARKTELYLYARSLDAVDSTVNLSGTDANGYGGAITLNWLSAVASCAIYATNASATGTLSVFPAYGIFSKYFRVGQGLYVGAVGSDAADNCIVADGTITATTALLTNLTDGYVPYHVSDAAGLANSGLYWDGTKLGIGVADPGYLLELYDATNTPAFAMSDDDVAHGVTTIAQTDTFLHMTSISTTAGGAMITGLTDTAAGIGLQLRGIQSNDPTDTVAAVSIIGAKAGTGGTATTIMALAAAETVFQVANNDNAVPAISVLGNNYVGVNVAVPVSMFEVAGDITLSQGGNRTILVSGRAASGNGYNLTIAAGAANTAGTGGHLYIKGGQGEDGSVGGNIYINPGAGVSTECVIIDSNSLLLGTGTASTKMTLGLLLNQGANDNEILAFQSSDVAHGMTALADTSTYGLFMKAEGAAGGLAIMGLKDADGISAQALALYGLLGEAADTTKSTAGIGVVRIQTAIKDAGTGLQAVGANGNLLSIDNYTTTRFILDADGDSHQDVGTAWTNFDDYDDVQLVTQLSAAVARPGDPLRKSFGKFLEQHKPELQRLKLATFNDDGHHFVNWSRMNMLLCGAVRQMGQKIDRLESRLQLQGGY